MRYNNCTAVKRWLLVHSKTLAPDGTKFQVSPAIGDNEAWNVYFDNIAPGEYNSLTRKQRTLVYPRVYQIVAGEPAARVGRGEDVRHDTDVDITSALADALRDDGVTVERAIVHVSYVGVTEPAN